MLYMCVYKIMYYRISCMGNGAGHHGLDLPISISNPLLAHSSTWSKQSFIETLRWLYNVSSWSLKLTFTHPPQIGFWWFPHTWANDGDGITEYKWTIATVYGIDFPAILYLTSQSSTQQTQCYNTGKLSLSPVPQAVTLDRLRVTLWHKWKHSPAEFSQMLTSKSLFPRHGKHLSSCATLSCTIPYARIRRLGLVPVLWLSPSGRQLGHGHRFLTSSFWLLISINVLPTALNWS